MKQIERRRAVFRFILAVYLLILFYFLFFAELMGREVIDRDYSYNLSLLKEINRFLVYSERLGSRAVFLNIYGNIIGFIPFGFLIPVSFKRGKGLILMTLLTFTASLVIETVQLVFRVGSFDVDDILLNTIGGVIGYLFYLLVRTIIRIGKGRHSERQK